MSRSLGANDLSQFTGSEHWYRHPINREFLYTYGVRYVADAAGAHWLIDEIALLKAYDEEVAAQEFQVWKLAVNAESTALLVCEDGNESVVYEKRIASTDFPVAGIQFYYTSDTLMLPSEY